MELTDVEMALDGALSVLRVELRVEAEGRRAHRDDAGAPFEVLSLQLDLALDADGLRDVLLEHERSRARDGAEDRPVRREVDLELREVEAVEAGKHVEELLRGGKLGKSRREIVIDGVAWRVAS